jgi:MinD-like ATPase involved in chromosome partitioning or flagellar assembly
MSTFCTFDEALIRTARLIRKHLPDTAPEQVRLIRDMNGRVLVVLPDAVDDAIRDAFRVELAEELGPYISGPEGSVSRLSETLSGEELMSEPALVHSTEDGPIYVLERRVVGQDWVYAPEDLASHPPRITFFSLKGGVGRSTALFLWGRRLVAQGKTVLLVDLDLEAPGLGAQLLLDQERPRYGALDWLVEDLVQNPEIDRILAHMSTQSSLADGAGLIVVPATGQTTNENPTLFVAKLARAYLELDETEQPSGFAARLRRLLETLEARIRPDVVLIDSRAGLHETAAATILHLDADVLFFATHQPTVWEGYGYLLSHLRLMAQMGSSTDPDDWRLRLKMVHAKADPTAAEEQKFLEHSYDLWIDNLYEEALPGMDAEVFSFGIGDEAAPHFPLTILRDERFERFNPLEHLSQIGETAIQAVFGTFATALEQRVLGEPDDE